MTNLKLWHVYLTGCWQTLLSMDTSVLGSTYCMVCVYREGHGTEVWRSCLARLVGKLWPAKHEGQPKVSSSNRHRASLGLNGKRRDNLKINKPISSQCFMGSGSRV